MLNILLNRYHVICSEKKILFSADVRKKTLRNVGRDDLLRTKKQDKFRHGYGLKSIRAVVNKYRGNMKLYYKTGEFHAVIYLRNE